MYFLKPQKTSGRVAIAEHVELVRTQLLKKKLA